ncbi:2OG-Fe dioxygenase family protein [Burkholderiaceae bacterium FT117]|uniref:2OG-Fe dioxygenase family protein n=1 Tax=Zeimonas sediminis TaxID=2944268 RepID=UPI002342C942|nr:2OG-Fe dioxygenase family protein [Zeimonas sediminis]MCM5569877.1 2OG-Fe dioxygenase family protein [Zeimonas sediminis]
MTDSGDWTLAGERPAETIARQGFARLAPAQLMGLAALGGADAARLAPTWNRLPPDGWLRDGGRYRRRRHSCFVHDTASGGLEQVPHRAHWQPVDYNALHGGIERMFDPVEAKVCQDPAWRRLLVALGGLFARAELDAGREPPDRWFIEAHQFRIDTSDGVGRPTPEGAHRDGVDYVAVILVERSDVRGGETRVFEADGPRGIRFVMSEPWSAVLLDDARMIHESTPIQPDGPEPHRDTLVLTYRRGGFQSPG